MFINNLYILLTILFLRESTSETCIPFLNSHLNNLTTIPDRVIRYNKENGNFEKFEFIKPMNTSLCSVDFSDDIRGKNLIVGVDELPPYVILTDNGTRVTGLYGDIWTTLEETLGFNSTYMPTRDPFIFVNGTIDIHLMVTLFYIESNTFWIYSSEIGETSYSIFSLSEGTMVNKWWYIHIFHKYVWAVAVLFVFIILCAILAVVRLQRKFGKDIEGNSEFNNIMYNFIGVIGAATGQGFQASPHSWSLRLCTLAALYMGLLLGCGFNSTLTSYLAFRSYYSGVSNIEKTLKTGAYSICVRSDTVAEEQLLQSIKTFNEDEISKKRWLNQVNRNCPNMYSDKELRNNLCKPGFVYVEASDVFMKMYRPVQNKCHIVKTGSYWGSQLTFAQSRGLKYRKLINGQLLRLRSAGVLRYLKTKWFQQQNWENSYFQYIEPVELGHIQLLVLGLIYAVSLSGLICFFEIIWFKHKNDKIHSEEILKLENFIL